ncbi:uncharacterized protein L969DRAFT_103948 [Mixia osmundae IAM 14324]|uniref:Peptidase A1 domain-containing protein n=1 Tax=Mixia osmundae (strain CBS 9802 / IAM 14324 / JCM 22182 / KY 12970) TaxID=764103 RepID=G7E739_MIXOS|nr:uncharacterized protein L969DRAFT_103948 [Mixia osmundae IAM 14324]KEI38964.1 hypothetical protein L969DRAFT_103948 [Mixia osmundae IAM 14324]GAA98649.1 hypothetical protein E5Q_05337 [Mixia osmundae IAM 14324]
MEVKLSFRIEASMRSRYKLLASACIVYHVCVVLCLELSMTYHADHNGRKGRYTAPLMIGSSTYDLLIDTGSSFAVVGLVKAFPYIRSPTTRNSSTAVYIQYAIGPRVKGWLVKDRIHGAGIKKPFKSYIVAIDAPQSYFDLLLPATGVLGLENTPAVRAWIQEHSEQAPADVVCLAGDALDQGSVTAAFATIALESGQFIIGPPAYRLAQSFPTWQPSHNADDPGSWRAQLLLPELDMDLPGLVDTGAYFTFLPDPAIDLYISRNPGVIDSPTGRAIIFPRGTKPKPLSIYIDLVPCKLSVEFIRARTRWTHVIFGSSLLRKFVVFFDYTNDKIGFAAPRLSSSY